MSTGNRCAIYDDIAALSEARTVADLVRRLQPILNELAYYGVTGETAVLEAHEEWRSQYNDSLRAESGSGSGSAAPPPPHVLDSARARPATSSSSREPRDSGSRDAREPRGARDAREPRGSRDAREPRDSREPEPHDSRAPQRPLRLAEDLEYESWAPAGRPAPGRPAPGRPAGDRTHTPAVVNSSGVPRALLAIMSGAHPSFRD